MPKAQSPVSKSTRKNKEAADDVLVSTLGAKAKGNGRARGAVALPQASDYAMTYQERLLRALRALNEGDLSVRMPTEFDPALCEISDELNGLISKNQALSM